VNAEGSVHDLVHGIKLHFTERTEENNEKLKLVQQAPISKFE
jgi:hypothetical protein